MALQKWISLRGGAHLVFVLRPLGPVNVGLMAAGTLVRDVRVGEEVELVSAQVVAGQTSAPINASVVRISIFNGASWQGTSAVAVSATHDRPVIIEVG
ncbi:hypothetical protein EON81_18850 [bacterium]|nr:MAG: hypothetical protein EON81_18850 [bacterium]